MFPNPGQQAAQRGSESSARQATQDGQRAAQAGARRSHSGSGRGGLLSFLLLVAVVVLVARDPELRASVLSFVHHIVNVVQNRTAGS